MSEPVIRSVRVGCTLHDAFTTFTARLDLWWPQAHRRFRGSVMVLEPWTGGGFLEKAPDGQEARLGEVRKFEPPHAFSCTWFPGAIEKPTLVQVTFVQQEDDVVVTVTHSEGESGLGDEWPRRAIRFAKSWDEVVPVFTSFLSSEESFLQEEE